MRSPWLWPFVSMVLVGGLLALALVWDAARLPGLISTVLPAALLALYGEKRALYIPGFGALNFGEPVYFAMAMEHGPATAALLAAAIGVLGDLLNRKAAYIVVFNVGWALLTFSAVGATAAALGYRGHAGDSETFVVFIVCVAVYLLVAGTLQAVAQVFMLDMPLRETARQQFQLMQYSSLAVLCIGGVSTVLLARQPWTLLLLAFPVEILSAYVERERLHQQLMAAQAALVDAEKRAAVGLLGAGVAHELNSPLAAILMNCHMLKMPSTPQDQAHCVGVIEKAATRGRDIVQALLNYARPQQARGSGDITQAIAECLLLLGHALAPAAVEIPQNSLPPVTMPTGDLMRVLTNLLLNARHAVDDRGKDGRVQVTAEVEPRRVIFRVKDNGCGVPAEVRERIWDPFFTTKPVGVGTGLGLGLVRSAVEQAGGTVDLESSDAGGSVFRVVLPRVEDSPSLR